MLRGKVLLPSLLGMALLLSLASEARSWRLNFFGFHIYANSPRSVSRRSVVDRRNNVARLAETERASTGGGAVGATLDRLVRGCLQQATEFQSWPYDAIIQIASPDDAQRSALEALRASTTAAAERLTAECPRDEAEPSGDRLVAAEQAVDTVTSSFEAVEPSLRAFFAALDDEQKARLMRELSSSGRQAREGDRTRERGERRSRRRSVSAAARGGEANLGAGICENFAAALRGWPIREIERSVRLSETQRVAFYELVTSSLKAADTLAGACPAENALTPLGRLTQMRARLLTVREATTAIRPALTQFYDALDQGQKVRFAAMR
jgi:LTXXQ motif family protein